MAPIRRYLRITKYSVLEVRIYLDNPALAQSWLLNPRKPVLPRVIESVRPLVLPKLREERERSRKRSTKKKGIKDVVVEDEFEVSIFLTETSTRHSLLTKQKHLHDTTQTKLTSNSERLVSATSEAPVDVDLDTVAQPATLRHEDEDEDAAVVLADIPAAPATGAAMHSRRPKRTRTNTTESERGREQDGGRDARDSDFEMISSDEDEGGSPASSGPPAPKRRKETMIESRENDDKKKLAMDVSYEGYSIYGRVLCLVVKRRDTASSAAAASAVSRMGANKGKHGGQGGQVMMENFIISTQMPAGDDAPP